MNLLVRGSEVDLVESTPIWLSERLDEASIFVTARMLLNLLIKNVRGPRPHI